MARGAAPGRPRADAPLLARIGRGASLLRYRIPRRRRDGEYRWFKTRGVPIRDTGGNIVKWFGTCTDITELRQSESGSAARSKTPRSASATDISTAASCA